MSLIELIHEHPVLTFFVTLLLVQGIVRIVMIAINRPLRHMNIRKHGWPPQHCDADGDSAKTVNQTPPLLTRIRNHCRTLSPHIKERQQAKLLMEAQAALDAFERLSKSYHRACVDGDGNPVRNCSAYLDRGLCCPECPIEYAEDIKDILEGDY